MLGNLDSKRDWGYAPEYCKVMWRILQHDTAEDYVLATGETHTIREFFELAFAEVGIELEWQGKGVNEKVVVKYINKDKLKSLLENSDQRKVNSDKLPDKLTVNNFMQNADRLTLNAEVVSVSPKYFRPTEVDLLIDNPTKAKEKLSWEAKIDLKELVRIMVTADVKKVIERSY